jgi:hypothetical protein
VQAARLGALIESGALDADAGYGAGFATSSDQLDINTHILRDLRSAAENLERILKEGFPA